MGKKISLKLSKLQKQFFFKLHCPKNERKLDKILTFKHFCTFNLNLPILKWNFKIPRENCVGLKVQRFSFIVKQKHSCDKVRTFWETHKIWKILPHGFDKSADLLRKHQNHEEDFFQIMWASQKVRTLIHLHVWCVLLALWKEI